MYGWSSPASPPLRLTIRACLDDHCRQCGLPVYRASQRAGRCCLSVETVSDCGTDPLPACPGDDKHGHDDLRQGGVQLALRDVDTLMRTRGSEGMTSR